MPLIIPANSLIGGYEIDNSLRFNQSSSDYLNRTPASSGNLKTNTLSLWIKRGSLTSNVFIFSQWSSDANSQTLSISSATGKITLGSGLLDYLTTTQVFRDVSAWYHFVVAVDTTQATASNRIKMYVNGSQITAFDTSNYPSQNADLRWGVNAVHNFFRYSSNSTVYNDNSYLSEACFIDGQQLDPTSFGEFDEDTGIWKPIDVSGLTFGTNGFYLDFENSGSLGADVSGNGNNFTVNNLTSIDQTTDTPTNNYATGNPLSPYVSRTISEGNLVHTSTTTHWTSLFSTIGVSSGKWWIELKATAGAYHNFGIVNDFPVSENGSIGDFTSIATQQIGYYSNSGTRKLNENTAAYGDTWTNGDIINMSLNLDDNELKFYKNGVVQASGTAITIPSGYTYFVGASVYNSSAVSFNFGSPSFSISSGNSDANGYGNFEYAVPSGYYALCTKNLAEFG